ncbi:glycerol-3-phosphate cytidylyltransferase [Caldithrix abyssi]|uniref:Glycerol-3-phosphate cytidylyltransferase n=1 Tax=Caldithrix abyssi DSM 13497 TaxID=880073 RepID=H1XSL2_CALAY|nr:Glycerol-3-phosphate cytidylyltransferase [Caldithrix abyssi DSM 13497]EHO42560.1 glycerol-3-phosphate cytidylyltransferase [Caldithrix abyssi DSM 13497]
MKKKTVITYGTFDLFHVGHLRLLKRAKELGDYLIVGVSTDAFNAIKGKKTIIPYEQRAEIVQSIRYVDRVIPEDSWEQKARDIEKYAVDVLVMGADWQGKFDDLQNICEVVYLPRTQGVSSSQLKNSLKGLLEIQPAKLREAIDVLEQILKDLE